MDNHVEDERWNMDIIASDRGWHASRREREYSKVVVVMRHEEKYKSHRAVMCRTRD